MNFRFYLGEIISTSRIDNLICTVVKRTKNRTEQTTK